MLDWKVVVGTVFRSSFGHTESSVGRLAPASELRCRRVQNSKKKVVLLLIW